MNTMREAAAAGRALIDPSHYRDPVLFAAELRTLFHRTWSFVGLLSELKGNAHYGVRVGDTELLIQRDKTGRARAYLNVCSHRSAQLCSTGLHRGAVRCPYHGWIYDRSGMPVGIPEAKAFPLVASNPSAFRLTELACETVGQFIFARIADAGPDLRDYLGDEYAFLLRISEGLGEVVDEFRRDLDCNWKVAVENSLEGYHVGSVHQATFARQPSARDEEGYAAIVNHVDAPLHTHMTHAPAAAWFENFERRTKPKLGRWPHPLPHYTHHLIFPNLTISSSLGHSYFIKRFEPGAVDRTTVHGRFIGVRFEDQDAFGAKMIERMYADAIQFVARVFDEDAAICRTVQRGLQAARRPPIFGDEIESRVAHFHRSYIDMLATGPQSAAEAEPKLAPQ